MGGYWGKNVPNLDDHLNYNFYAAGTGQLWGLKTTANLGYGRNSSDKRDGLTFGLAAEKSLNDTTALGVEYFMGDRIDTYADLNPEQNGLGVSHANLYLTEDLGKHLSARAAVGGLGQNTSLVLGAAYHF